MNKTGLLAQKPYWFLTIGSKKTVSNPNRQMRLKKS